ncbi:MAG: efflux RND transporter periplasmic adaptor subunit [Phycisphaerae bacterium]
MTRTGWMGGVVLLGALAGVAFALAQWKQRTNEAARITAESFPEMPESITAAIAQPREYRRSTVSVGTVLATRSITLRNELAGTIKEAALIPGSVVDAGTVLVALDVSVEEAELAAHEAQAAFAQSEFERINALRNSENAATVELDRVRSEREVALANVARTKALIAKKTIRAPFRTRVGMTDIHVGQYLEEGTELTTLQGVDDDVHVDFTVPQQVAMGLREGDFVDVFSQGGEDTAARIVAIDARIDPQTRNARVRAKLPAAGVPSPGASVRVRVPVGEELRVVAVPVSALRKGPAGDHVFVIAADDTGKLRAYVRPVRAGTMIGDDVLLLSGVRVGERVAALGSFKLRDAALVAVTAGKPADVSAARP